MGWPLMSKNTRALLRDWCRGCAEDAFRRADNTQLEVEMSDTAIKFPEPDHARNAFRMWAAQHFDDELRDPLWPNGRGGYHHQRVNDAWEAWKTASQHVAAENAHLRKLLEKISKHTLNNSIVFEPEKPI